MTVISKIFLGAGIATLCASCAGPSARSSLGRDVYGHRPGPKGFKTVIIDAGHGGKDSGATSPSTGQHEKDLALDTAKRVARNLSRDFRVILMRSDDTFVDLDDRVIRANRSGADLLVSVHYNSSAAGIRGPETYYWRVDSHGLATRIQQAMTAVSPAESGNRGLVRRRIRLTRNPEIPCVLAEIGYLSNPSESRLVADSAYRQKQADAISSAIRTQAAIGDAGTGPLPSPINVPPSRPTDSRE